MSRTLCVLVLGATALAAAPRARAQSVSAAAADTASPVDRQRAAWRYRRTLELRSDAGGPLAALPLPPEVWTRAQGDLRDLRLIDAQGSEQPYAIDRQAARESAPAWSGTLVDARREAKLRSEWVVDLAEPRTFDLVTLDVPGSGFAKRLRVEASDDRSAWRLLRDDAGIFERDWHGSLRHTRVELSAPTRARYLRLSADDRHSAPIDLSGASVQELRRLGAARWSRAVALLPTTAPHSGTSAVRLDLPAGLPLESVTLDALDVAFSRDVRLVEHGPTGERSVRAEARLYRLPLDDEGVRSESLRFDVARVGVGVLSLEITNGDSPPLRGLRVTVSGTTRRLLFAAVAGPLTLYYGNPATRAPLYDLEALRAQLALAPALAEARVADEAKNPQHAPAAPLGSVPSAGAALDIARWRVQRGFTLHAGEDIYGLTLAAQDLARLRDDLGDLRLADAQGRQVPYIVEPGVAEERVPLVVAREQGAGRRRDARAATLSVHRLTPDLVLGLPGAAGLPAVAPPRRPLPLQRLELRVQDGFFARSARVLAPAEPGRRETVLWQGPLARAAGAPETPLTIALDGRRHAALLLEIDEGDNAPLVLTEAAAFARVPRVTFKAAPGEYRLLLERDDATPPRYDLATLRQEVLAYSAVPVTARAPEDNPAYRRRAVDYVAGAPPTLVLWGTLLLAVAGLLVLTVRVLRKAEV